VAGRGFQLFLILKLLLSSRKDILFVRDKDIFILKSLALSGTCELETANSHLTGGCQRV